MSAESGRRLKRARETRGLTLDDVSRMTGIDPQYLMAIESGQLESLPGPYVRSYLRSYAQCVGEDPQVIIRLSTIGRTTMGSRTADLHTRTRANRADGTGRETRRSSRRRAGSTETAASSEEVLIHRDRRWNTGRQRTLSRVEQPVAPRRTRLYPPPRQTGEELGSSFSRQQWEEEIMTGKRTDEQTTAPRIEVPSDWPDPSELGIRSVEPKAEANEIETLPEIVPDKMETARPRLSRRSKKQSASGGAAFSKWYARFLIAGAVLFVIAAIALGITMYMDDHSAPVKQKTTQNVSEEGTATTVQKPFLNPAVTSAVGPDQYELVNAKEIQLNVVAVGDATVTLRNQEIGTPLVKWQLKSGDQRKFSYSNDLWITVANPRNVKITVFGQTVNTDYSNEKEIEIKLIK